MNHKWKLILGVTGLCLLMILAYVSYQTLSARYQPDVALQKPANNQTTDNAATQEGSAEESVVNKAPDFTVFDADGNQVQLSNYFGKPIVLNFWASWCPPCKGEMPHFEEAYNERGEEIQFLMIDMVDGKRETQQKGVQFIKDQGYQFPVLYDTKQNAAITYGVYSLPTTYFIDKAGTIVASAEGAINKEALLKGIEMIRSQ